MQTIDHLVFNFKFNLHYCLLRVEHPPYSTGSTCDCSGTWCILQYDPSRDPSHYASHSTCITWGGTWERGMRLQYITHCTYSIVHTRSLYTSTYVNLKGGWGAGSSLLLYTILSRIYKFWHNTLSMGWHLLWIHCWCLTNDKRVSNWYNTVYLYHILIWGGYPIHMKHGGCLCTHLCQK